MPEPRLLQGGLAVDDRGVVSFVNAFGFEGVRRFYVVTNHARGFVRAWHGHRREEKFLTAVQGSLLVCCVAVDDWARPSPDLPVQRFTLSERAPAVLHVPAGFAHGTLSLTEGARLLVFSTATLEESLGDDFRFPARYWDPWPTVER